MTDYVWLEAKVDQRIAFMKDEMLKSLGNPPEEVMAGLMAMQPIGLMMTFLTEPREDATKEEQERWEHTCDGCGRYFLNGLHNGTAHRELWGKQVIISFGVCTECKEAKA